MAIALITNHSLPSCQTFSFDRLLHYNFYIWRSIARCQTLKSLHYLKKIQKACSRCNTPTASIQCIDFQESASIQYSILINKRQLFDLQHFLKDLPHPFKRPQWTLLGAAATTEANHQLSISNANPIAAAQIRSFGPNLSRSIMDQRNDLIFESKTNSLVFKVFCYVAPTAKFGKLPDPLHASTFLSKIAMIHYACMYVYICIYLCVCVAHWSVGSVEAIWKPWCNQEPNHPLDPRMGCRWVWPVWPTQPSGRSPT